jgi:hypothetical protein
MVAAVVGADDLRIVTNCRTGLLKPSQQHLNMKDETHGRKQTAPNAHKQQVVAIRS